MSSLKFCRLFEELKTTDATLTTNAESVFNFLNELPIALSDDEKVFFDTCIGHYESIVKHSNFWDKIETPDEKRTPEEIAAIFKTMNDYLADEVENESFKKRAESCAWISIHFTEILELFKKIPDSPEKNAIVSTKLITPVQRLPRLTLFSKEWLKESPEDLVLQSINRKFLRIVSTLNQLLKVSEYETLHQKATSSIFDKLFGTAHLSKIDEALIENSIGNSLEFSMIPVDHLQLSLMGEDAKLNVDETFYENLAQFNENIEQYQLDHSISDLPPVLDEFIAFFDNQNAPDDPTIPQYNPPELTNSMIMRDANLIGDVNVLAPKESKAEVLNQVIELKSPKNNVNESEFPHEMVPLEDSNDEANNNNAIVNTLANNQINDEYVLIPKESNAVVEEAMIEPENEGVVKKNNDISGKSKAFIVAYVVATVVLGTVGVALSASFGPIGMIAGAAIGVGLGFAISGLVEGILSGKMLFSILFGTGATITGAGLGALLGTLFFPGFGTIIGAVIGAAIGAGTGAGVGLSVAGLLALFTTDSKLGGTLLLAAGTTGLGAGIGAIIGTIILTPGIGTAIGASIGAGAGFLATIIPAAITLIGFKINQWSERNDEEGKPVYEINIPDENGELINNNSSHNVITNGLGEEKVQSNIENIQPHSHTTILQETVNVPKDSSENQLTTSTSTTSTTSTTTSTTSTTSTNTI